MERWIDRKTVFDGRIFRVESGIVRLDDGTEAKRDVVILTRGPWGSCR